MARGRKPKPTAVKEREGNPGKRALNSKEPQPDVQIPTCPTHLKGEARREWTRITKILMRLRVITELDRGPLAAYCTAYADYVQAVNKLKAGGEVQTSENGGEYQSPWGAMKKRSMEQLVKIGTEFGLTPSSRVRLQVDDPDSLQEKERRLFPHSVKDGKK